MQLRVQEEEKASLESANNSTKMELAESDTRVSILLKENTNLKRDKDILTDHVADLQRQVNYSYTCIYVSYTCLYVLYTCIYVYTHVYMLYTQVYMFYTPVYILVCWVSLNIN